MATKVTDLMAGDWIHSNDTNDNRQIWPIGYQTTSPIKRMDVTLEDCNCEPIPLSDDILKKTGFQYFHKNFASLSYDHPFKLEKVEWPNGDDIGLWMLGGLFKIRYVHELQHAFRLAGIDKEIKLEE